MGSIGWLVELRVGCAGGGCAGGGAEFRRASDTPGGRGRAGHSRKPAWAGASAELPGGLLR